MQPGTSLYERIGGAEAVRSMVEQFYQRVLADEELAPHFHDAPMNKLQHMQTEFFSAALDGPSLYSGRPVRHAHAGLNISTQEFQRFVAHLFETLEGYGLSDADRYEVIARLNTYTDDVVGTTDPL